MTAKQLLALDGDRDFSLPINPSDTNARSVEHSELCCTVTCIAFSWNQTDSENQTKNVANCLLTKAAKIKNAKILGA